jgi:hypothetical protein
MQPRSASLPRLGPGRSGRRLRCLLLAACLLAPGLAAVAEAAPPGAALEKFEEGVRAFTANHPEEALAAFQASMELEPSPNTRFKIAKCYLALNKPASAYSSFRRAAREAQDRIQATGEQRFAPTRAAAEAEAALLLGRVPHLLLKVPADLAGEVSLVLDGSPLPPATWSTPLDVDPGPHRLSATGPHIEPYEATLDIKESETRELELPLLRIKSGAILLSFKQRPAGITVAVDAQAVGPDQVDHAIALSEGLHKLVVSAPGYADFTAEPTVRDKENLPVIVSMTALPPPTSRVPRAAVFTIGGATLAVVVAAIGFGAQAQITADQQTALDPLKRDPGVRDMVRQDATVANVLFIASGALAITTAGLAIATRWRNPPVPASRKLATFGRPLANLGLTAAGEGGQ